MKIANMTLADLVADRIASREQLPPGKLNIRHRQERGVWQAYAGKRYLDLASGDTPEQAAEEIATCYVVPAGSTAIVHHSVNGSPKPIIAVPV